MDIYIFYERAGNATPSLSYPDSEANQQNEQILYKDKTITAIGTNIQSLETFKETTINNGTAKTIQGMMSEDIDGEISSNYNEVSSQGHEENITLDPLEEAFLRQYDDEEIININIQDEVDNQELAHQHLQVSDFQINQQNIEIPEPIQPRRSSRLSEKRQQQPRDIPQVRRSKQIQNIARSCDVQSFKENDILCKISQHYAGLLFDNWCKWCNAY